MVHEEPQSKLTHEERTCHKRDLNLSVEDNNSSFQPLKQDLIDLKFQGHRVGFDPLTCARVTR
jgi:hypothetical protein